MTIKAAARGVKDVALFSISQGQSKKPGQQFSFLYFGLVARHLPKYIVPNVAQ